MFRITQIGLLLFAVLLLSNVGAEQDEPMFVKVYAGKSLENRRAFNKVVRKNLKDRAAIPAETVIECEPGDWYGLGVIVSARGRQFLNFETTAIWRDLSAPESPRHSTREHTLRKEEFGTRRFFFKIRNRSVDHDMTFVAHVGKQVYLRHKFLIRGCEAT